MADLSIEELRRWAAQVCGWTTYRGHEYSRWIDHEWRYVLVADWRPDENIAQLFEVFDALGLEPQMILLKREPVNRWGVTVSKSFQPGPEGMAQHERRETAGLLAAYAAWQTKEGA